MGSQRLVAIAATAAVATVLAIAAGDLASGYAGMPSPAPTARFDWIEYAGRDPVFARAIRPDQYRNPVLAGFYPDPAVVRVGPDYYMVNSTFAYFPGLPIWHSRDLVDWKQIGNVVDRAGMVGFAGLHLGKRGLYAPTIMHHRGRFIVANTCVDCGGNFVVTAQDPAGPWSDPVWIKGVGGIDPHIYFEGDRAWLVNHDDPAGPPLYDGHKAIWIREISPATFQPVGRPVMIVDGGVHIADKPGYVEGPHLFRRGAYYYLSAAEGGTGTDHRQAVWRARNIMGPFEPFPGNPILTQRDLPADRANPITSTGHADLIETQKGDWWAVFLGTRTYNGTQFNTGRETFLLPVRWRDGWPMILDHGKSVPFVARRPDLPHARLAAPSITGNFTAREDFNAALGKEWMFVRVPQNRWWSVAGGQLLVAARDDRLGDVSQPSVVVRRLQHMHATVTTRMRFVPRSQADEAGLVALQNDNFFYAFGLTRNASGTAVLKVRRRAGEAEPRRGQVVATVPVALGTAQPLDLRITVGGPRISFAYSLAGRAFRNVLHGADAEVLSTMRSDGFNGATLGVYAEGAGR